MRKGAGSDANVAFGEQDFLQEKEICAIRGSSRPSSHRRRSGWTSGGTHGERRRWVRAEWGGYREGCPLFSRL